MSKIGLIAGSGNFPIYVAAMAREIGDDVITVAIAEEAALELDVIVARVHRISVGQLERIIQCFKDEGISRVIMAGKVHKTLVFSGIAPDERAMLLMGRLPDFKDDTILTAVADELATEGIILMDSTAYLSEMLAEKGCMTERTPTDAQNDDITFGWEIAKEMGRLDIGQSVVVKNRAVLAVEAIEGTDEAIKRGGVLGRGDVVVVKVSKPQQDTRFDVPVVGLSTVESLRSVGGGLLAVEAGKTFVVERDEAVALANDNGIAIVGVIESDSPHR